MGAAAERVADRGRGGAPTALRPPSAGSGTSTPGTSATSSATTCSGRARPLRRSAGRGPPGASSSRAARGRRCWRPAGRRSPRMTPTASVARVRASWTPLARSRAGTAWRTGAPRWARRNAGDVPGTGLGARGWRGRPPLVDQATGGPPEHPQRRSCTRPGVLGTPSSVLGLFNPRAWNAMAV